MSILHPTRLVEVIRNARVGHAKDVSTKPDGDITDLDFEERTVDQAIADAIDRYLCDTSTEATP